MRVDSPVYRAAATMIHRKAGSATMPILIGAISEVSQIAIALMITMNSPSVEYRSRPVSATRTGRAKRLTSTRIAAQLRKPMGPAPRRRDDGHFAVPAERERLGDRDRTEEEHDEREQDRVEHDLDDETTHLASSAIRLSERSRGIPFWRRGRSRVQASSAPSCRGRFGRVGP